MRHMSTETRKYYFKQAEARCKPIQLKYEFLEIIQGIVELITFSGEMTFHRYLARKFLLLISLAWSV